MNPDETWHGGRPRPWPRCVRLGPSSRSPKRGHRPPILAHVYCGQTAGWIKMPLGTEVGLGSGHSVLDGDPAPSPQKREHIPQFSAHICYGQTAGWMKVPLGTKVSLDLGHTLSNRLYRRLTCQTGCVFVLES